MIINYNRNLIPNKIPTKSEKKLVRSDSSNAETDHNGFKEQADDIARYFSNITQNKAGQDNLYDQINKYNEIEEKIVPEADAEFEERYLLNILI